MYVHVKSFGVLIVVALISLSRLLYLKFSPPNACMLYKYIQFLGKALCAPSEVTFGPHHSILGLLIDFVGTFLIGRKEFLSFGRKKLHMYMMI